LVLTMGNAALTIKSGGLVPVLLMLPNIVWMLLPKIKSGNHVSEPLLLTIAENIGRAAVLILPFFYPLDLNRKYSAPALIGMGLALALYYAAWLRYFTGGRSQEFLRLPLWGLPLPLAVAPVGFLILSSYLMSSWPMLGASLLFGIAHIRISAITQ
jgi:hypothetical protein